MKILIISPHFDDAVLSVCDHIRKFKTQNIPLKVITIFTRFEEKNLSEDSLNYVKKSGFSSIAKFAQVRKSEDIQAMQKLGVTYSHWKFIDGGFRSYKEAPIYPSYKQLFSGTLSPKDNKLCMQIEEKLKQLERNAQVFIPLGIGNHVDHIIIRKQAEKFFPQKNINYYIDQPYARTLMNWNTSFIQKIVGRHISFLKFSQEKDAILRSYASQIPILFTKPPHYLEIVLANFPIRSA